MFKQIKSLFAKSKQEYSVKDEFKPYITFVSNAYHKAYIEERVLGQINWYDKRSVKHQNTYKRMSFISIILTSFIPILTLLSDSGLYIKVAITTLSTSATAIASILTLNNSKELWVQYRANCEILKSVLHRYFTQCDEFKISSEDAFNMLVSSCEQYMTKEFLTWKSQCLSHDTTHSSSSSTNS